MSPDGKECNEWTEWVNEVSAGGRDKGPAFISLRSLLAGLVPCLSPRVSSLRRPRHPSVGSFLRYAHFTLSFGAQPPAPFGRLRRVWRG